MSDQNAMFSPQENVPHEQQAWQEVSPVREQRSSDHNSDDYSAGYSGTEPGAHWMSDQKLRPPRTIPVWQWIVGGLLLLALAPVVWSLINIVLGFVFLLLGIGAVLLAISQFSLRAIVVPPQIFTLQEQPRLIIRNPTGSILIHRGETNKVEVKATKYVNGWFGSTNEGAVDMVQDGDMINVTTRSGSPWSVLGGLRNVTIDITTSEFSDIQIEGNAGTISIEGISGQVRASTNAGTITVEQTTLDEQSILKTNAGTISVRQAILKGNVRFDTNAGTISFNGMLDPQGSYRFATNMGTIDVTLPDNPSFILVATTDLGTVANAFDGTTVGPAPHARLELRTNLGTVSVHRG